MPRVLGWAPRLERRRTIKLTRFSLVVLIEGRYYAGYYGMKAHFYTHLKEGGCTIHGDALIEERSEP